MVCNPFSLNTSFNKVKSYNFYLEQKAKRPFTTHSKTAVLWIFRLANMYEDKTDPERLIFFRYVLKARFEAQ